MTRQELAQPPAPASASARRPGRRPRRRLTVFGLIATAVALAAVFGAYPLFDRAAAPVVLAVGDALDTSPDPAGSTGVAGGELPDGTATLDDDLPAITGLDPELRKAVRQAAADAAADDIDFWITSGWRSPAFQEHLFDEAVRTKGLAEARRKVSTPEKSNHVSGKAVDIGPTEGDYWLIEHGTDYGLCQAYSNEIWHFELLTEPGGTCPPMLDGAAG